MFFLLVSSFFSSENLIGSESYIPSTLVPLRMISDFISEALKTAAVSVEKNGLPVPEAKITTLFFSRRCKEAFQDPV